MLSNTASVPTSSKWSLATCLKSGCPLYNKIINERYPDVLSFLFNAAIIGMCINIAAGLVGT